MKVNKTSKVLLSIILGFLFFIALKIHNSPIYIVVGLLIISFLFTNLFKTPEFLLVLCLSAFIPLFYTFGYLKIENLNFAILTSLSIIALFLSIYQNKGVANLSNNILLSVSSVFIIFFVGILNGNLVLNLKMLIQFFVYGFLPILIASISLKSTNQIYLLLERIIYFNFVFLISFILLYIFSTYSIFKWKIESSIGLSFFCLFNIIIILLYRPRSLFMLFSLFLSIILIIILFQRSFIFALLMLSFWIIINRGNLNNKLKILLLTCLLIFVIAPIIIPKARLIKIEQTKSFTKHEKLSSLKINENLESISIRLYLWDTAIKHTINNSIFLGNGFGRFEELTGFEYPHNLLIDIFFCTGLLGLLMFFIFCTSFLILITDNKIFRKSYEFIILTGSIGAVFTVLMFSGGFNKSSFYLFIFLIGFSLIYKRLYIKNLL